MYALFSLPVLIPVGAGLISPALTALGLLADGLGFDPDALGIPFLLLLLRFAVSLQATVFPLRCSSRTRVSPAA
jgi:hypothetical protein